MRPFAAGALLVMLAADCVGAAEPPLDQMPSAYKAPWYKRWFGIGPEPPKPPPPTRRDPAAEAAGQRAAAQANLERRLGVCDALRQIAVDTENQELEAKAFRLEQNAWEVYKQQTAHLPCNRLMPSEEKLERRLGPAPSTAAAAAEKLTPAKPETTRTSQANAFREVKP